MAAFWFKKSADQGSPIAQYNLGNCYKIGQGVIKDIVETYAYFNLSGISHEPARKNREKLEKEMTRSQITAGQKRSKELQKEIEAKINAKGEKK